jgi:hypothetical protein
LQDVGSGLIRKLSHISSFTSQICRERSVQNPWKEKIWRNVLKNEHMLNFEESGKSQFAQVMRFNRETVHDLFTLFKKAMDAKQLKRLLLMYKDKTELQLTCTTVKKMLLVMDYPNCCV